MTTYTLQTLMPHSHQLNMYQNEKQTQKIGTQILTQDSK